MVWVCYIIWSLFVGITTSYVIFWSELGDVFMGILGAKTSNERPAIVTTGIIIWVVGCVSIYGLNYWLS